MRVIEVATADDGGEVGRELFSRAAGFELSAGESLLTAVTTAAAIFLVIATAAAAFKLWASDRQQGFGEAELIGLLLRALSMLSILAAIMAYMARTAG